MSEVPDLVHRVLNLEFRVTKTEDIINTLRADIQEIRATLASKEDIAHLETTLKSEISDNVNGILRDAINATPANATATWAKISGITFIVTAILGAVFGILDLIKITGHG